MRRFDPWCVLIALSLALSVLQVASLTARAPVPEGLNVLISYTWSFYIIYWVVRDARKRRRIPCHEFGFLVAVFLPVSLAWYVFWTRGWRGIGPLAGLFGLANLPSIAWHVTWMLV
jgi:hypothetical protein